MNTDPASSIGAHLGRRGRITILCIVTIAAVVAVALHAPIPQSAAYHHFADPRRLLGIPNFWNVMSNLPFLIVGLLGLRTLLAGQPTGAVPALRPAYLCLFAGVALVALGSGYYHLAPGNQALVWDRLPMTMAFMALFCVIIGEHIDERMGLRLLVPLVILGAASVMYWQVFGDLRPYVLVQFLPLLLAPLILLLYPSRLSHVSFLWALFGAYVAAKLLELGDEAIFAWSQVASGHTLKHLCAGLGMYIFLLAVRQRRPKRIAAAPAGSVRS